MEKKYRVVGVYVLFVIIINEVHSGAMVVTKDVSGRSNCYVSVNSLVWCLLILLCLFCKSLIYFPCFSSSMIALISISFVLLIISSLCSCDHEIVLSRIGKC